MVDDDVATVKCLDHVAYTCQDFVCLYRTEVVECKHTACTYGGLLILFQLFLRDLLTNLLDVESLVCLDRHQMEDGLLDILLKADDANVAVGIVE